MDEREMKTGVIPLRHASLPGHVKLPRRYEKAAMGTNGIPTRVRKISIQPGHSSLGDSLSDRLDDLMAAIMWVKQELIMLRQHDILLKRQFFNIQHSIKSLQKPKTSTANTSTTSSSTTTTTPHNSDNHHIPNGDTILEETASELDSRLQDVSTHQNSTTDNNNNSHNHSSTNDNDVSDFPLDTYVVRPSSSVTMLNEDSDEEEDADTFAEEFFFRPRTSSMRTSRDMAALARRRGSKELI